MAHEEKPVGMREPSIAFRQKHLCIKVSSPYIGVPFEPRSHHFPYFSADVPCADEISTKAILHSYKKADALVRLQTYESQSDTVQLLVKRVSEEIGKEIGGFK